MAFVPMTVEYMAEYAHGMGSQFFLVRAPSPEVIQERYPLFSVYPLGESSHTPEQVEILRMYPGEGRPLDTAVRNRSPEERERFVEAAMRQREEAHQRYVAANFPLPAREQQYWVDIDDDAEFRMQMHQMWKGDERYLALPPERRLF
jgi:hypothetical protein